MIYLTLFLTLTAVALFFFGYGISILITPKSLSKFVFWLSPWYSVIFITICLVIFSLLKIPTLFSSPFVVIFLSALTVFIIFKQGFKINQNGFFDLILMIFVIGSVIFNVSPLIRRDKIMTTISLGNNDVIAYATTGDYLIKNTIFKSLDTPIPGTDVDNLLYKGYRWGVPSLNAFFLNIFNLKGYQYSYCLQVVLFALMLPLQYILFNILYGKKNYQGSFLILILTAFNVNLLYILYHNFFGQVLFWGLEIFIYIFLFSYFSSEKIEEKSFNIYDYILGFSLTALFFSYHEPLIFIVMPLLFFLILTTLKNYKKTFIYFYSCVKIAFITFLTSSFSIFFALVLDYVQGLKTDPNQPIGWALFRNKIPFANPFEAMGFWSIHNFEPMPIILAITLSIIIILIIIKGVLKSRYKTLIASYLLVFSLFFYWTAISQYNFFTYNRALTYSLPLLIAIFSIGVISFFQKWRLVGLAILILLISLEVFSGMKLNKRFRAERLSVDKSFISILGLKKININQPVYIESFITDKIPLWKQIWTRYFLYYSGISTLPSEQIADPYKNRIPDNSLLLLSKSTPWIKSPSVIFNDIIWGNQYYRLGHLCNSDGCLIKTDKKLSIIKMGNNDYEDSLLISGWEQTEGETRWASQKESTLRLITKEANPINFTVEALSLSKPQKITVYLDNQLLGEILIGTEWKNYSLPITYPLNLGVHKIKLVYSNGYRPMDVIPDNIDSRILYVNFKEIKLE